MTSDGPRVTPGPKWPRASAAFLLLTAIAVTLVVGCAAPGHLKFQASTVAPVPKDTVVGDFAGRSR